MPSTSQPAPELQMDFCSAPWMGVDAEGCSLLAQQLPWGPGKGPKPRSGPPILASQGDPHGMAPRLPGDAHSSLH